jgi:hypothetical protein
MKKLTLILIGLFAGMQLLDAQTTITGKVTSKKDGKAISGAVINAKEKPDVTAVSGTDGTYSITVTSDVKVLEATYTGMEKRTEGIGQKKIINFEMMPASSTKQADKTKKVDKTKKNDKPKSNK